MVAIVEDDENDRSLVARAVDQSPDLESLGSYSSGLEALKGIPSSVTEVVLMDVRMPRMSGIECTRRLKNVRPHLIIIMVSGLDDPDTITQALQAGADAYLTKPFSLPRFFEILAVCLRRRKPGVNETLAPQTFPFTRSKEMPKPPQTASSVLSASGQCVGNSIQHERSSAEQEQGLMSDEPNVRNALLRIIITLEENVQTREDLLQEALVYFWSRERQRPGQRLSWYLQGVRFYLHHLKTSGRSLDSPKHRRAQVAFADSRDGWDEWRDSLELDEGIMSAVHAHDICSLLLDRLKPIDRTILTALADGLGVHDIAERLKISHQSVIRHRERIAVLAIKLGVVAPLAW